MRVGAGAHAQRMRVHHSGLARVRLTKGEHAVDNHFLITGGLVLIGLAQRRHHHLGFRRVKLLAERLK